jgi:hypothetical protein
MQYAGGIEPRARGRQCPPQHSIALDQSLTTTLANSPINIENLAMNLSKYPLRAQVKELEEGFRFGFRLGFIGKE